MKQIVIVIGDRMGKGAKIAAGIEAAGCKAIVVPGMAADMKLGDVMNAENADLGLSFCGSGGAGALTAKNKYGYEFVTVCAPSKRAKLRLPKGAKCLVSALWTQRS